MRKRKATTSCRFEFPIDNYNAPNSIRKAPRKRSNRVGNTNIAVRRKKRTWAKIATKFNVSDGKLVLDLPIRTVSEANCFEPWQKKHGRHKEQQRIVALALGTMRSEIKLPCKIMLTRFAPDELDKFDNLPMSFKYIVDAICAVITGEYRAGKADGDKRISIACDQVESKAYGIRIELTY